MTRQVWIGGLAGGVVFFVWSVVVWTLLPIHQSVFRSLPDEVGVVDALGSADTPAGLYAIPGPPAESGTPEEAAEAERQWEEKSRRGPTGFIIYRPGGRAPNRMFRPLATGLLASLASGIFSAWALSRARIRGHLGRIAFVAGLGLFGWVLGSGLQGYGLQTTPLYLLATLIDAAGGWVIVGVVQAGIVRP